MGPFSPLETAMAVFLTAVCLSLTLGYALPVDPRKQVPGGEDGKNVPLPANVHGNPNRPRIPEVPGLDKEEYNRYWREMVLANPGKSRVCGLAV